MILQIKICSYIFDKSKVILKPYGFSVILFAENCRRQYHLSQDKYHCEAIKLAERRIKLRSVLMNTPLMAGIFVCSGLHGRRLKKIFKENFLQTKARIFQKSVLLSTAHNLCSYRRPAVSFIPAFREEYPRQGRKDNRLRFREFLQGFFCGLCFVAEQRSPWQ